MAFALAIIVCFLFVSNGFVQGFAMSRNLYNPESMPNRSEKSALLEGQLPLESLTSGERKYLSDTKKLLSLLKGLPSYGWGEEKRGSPAKSAKFYDWSGK